MLGRVTMPKWRTGRGAVAALPALLLLAAACAGPTPYAPANGGYGYRDQALAPDRYRIVVAGNRLTPRERVADYLLYRAAELTQAQGGVAFTMLHRDMARRTSYRRVGAPVAPFRYGAAGACPGDCRLVDGLTTTRLEPEDRYRATAEIVIHDRGDVPQRPETYDAATIRANLAERVAPQRPPSNSP